MSRETGPQWVCPQVSFTSMFRTENLPEFYPYWRAEQRSDEPEPAVQTRGGDAAKIGSYITAVGDTRAIAEQQPSPQGDEYTAERDMQGRKKASGQTGRETGAKD